MSTSPSSPNMNPVVDSVADPADCVLFVDLDGTLIVTDMLWESFVGATKRDAWLPLKLPLWLLQGRAHLKQMIAQRAVTDVPRLPYRDDVVEFLRQEHRRGRKLVLATASDRALGRAVADHLQIFDDVLASDGQTNLKGRQKLLAIHRYCREHGHTDFAYLGDSRADLHVWSDAAQTLIVQPTPQLLATVKARDPATRVFGSRPPLWRSALRALRPLQWVKNILLFLPLLLAHELKDLDKLMAAIAGFLAFCACASAVYVTNDLLDLEADRQHPRKRFRPLASGALPIGWGPSLAAGLFLFAFAISAIFLPWGFVGLLLVYLITTSLYSLKLKRVAMIDVFVLAGLYTLRILAGGVATDLVVSEWLLMLSLFLFTSLAFAKRYAELTRLANDNQEVAMGRGYRVVDLGLIETLGPTSGYMAVLVMALYIHSDNALRFYPHSRALWLVCPLLLYWISRLWLLAKRQELDEDPVIFAVTDRVSRVVGLLTAILALVASVPW